MQGYGYSSLLPAETSRDAGEIVTPSLIADHLKRVPLRSCFHIKVPMQHIQVAMVAVAMVAVTPLTTHLQMQAEAVRSPVRGQK